jgi:hypothetical protein
MSNREASHTSRLSGDTSPLSLPTATITVPFNAIQGGDLDVPDTTVADTVYEVPFGSCEEATHVQILNSTGQEIAARIGGASVTGTLVLGTVTIAFPAAAGERLSAELGAANGGTPGKLHVRRSAGNVIVESYTVDGIQDADVSDVTVYNNAPPILPDGGILVLSTPAAGSGVSSASAILTDVQDGAGKIVAAVLGDPV